MAISSQLKIVKIKKKVLPNVQAKPFIPNVSQDNRQGVLTANQQVRRPNVPPPN